MKSMYAYYDSLKVKQALQRRHWHAYHFTRHPYLTISACVFLIAMYDVDIVYRWLISTFSASCSRHVTATQNEPYYFAIAKRWR